MALLRYCFRAVLATTAFHQQAAQYGVDSTVSAYQSVVDCLLVAVVLQGISECLEFGQVGGPHGLGIRDDAWLLFQVEETHSLFEGEVEFSRVEDLEKSHFMLAVSQVFEAGCERFQFVDAITQDDDDSSFLKAFSQFMKERASAGCG